MKIRSADRMLFHAFRRWKFLSEWSDFKKPSSGNQVCLYPILWGTIYGHK